MADFRDYQGIDFSSFLAHYGVGHEQGGHSGRYEWGSGDRPMQDSPLDKGSATKPYRYVPSKSIESTMHRVAKKLKEGKISIQTIHTAKADVEKANKEYLSFIGYGSDKNKQKLNREEKDQQALVVKADNHENRPHARTQKIVEGTAKVKVKDAESNQQHLPAIYGTTAYMNYVPSALPWVHDVDLPTLDGTTNEGHRPDDSLMYMTYEQYESLTQKPVTDTFLSYYGQEKKKLDKLINSPVTKLVIGMAKVADKVSKVLKRLKNVVVSAFKHSDDGFFLIEQGYAVGGYIGVDRSSKTLKHYGVGHEHGGHSGRYPWGSKHNVPLSPAYDVASAKNAYKKAKRKKNYLKTELKQKRMLSEDADEAYSLADEKSTGLIFKKFENPDDKKLYKKAKREKKYARAVAKEAKAQYEDAKEDLEKAKENIEAEKQRVKGQKDAMKDAWTVIASNPGFRGDQPSDKDLRRYAMRHPDEVKSTVTSILSFIGGMKVTGEYKQAYEKEFDAWIKYVDQYYNNDRVLERLKDSSRNLKVRS